MFKFKPFFLIVIILALFVRLYQFQNYSLEFDQVQILENANKIKQGDFTLIGPRTGPAQMFTGPLVYYICAFFSLFFSSPWSIIPTAISVSLFSGICLYFLLQRYSKDPNFQKTYFLLWALSPFIVFIDRNPWNPIISISASFLVFFPLLKIIRTQKFKLLDLLLISFGVFLSYQAHFSGFLFIPIIFFTCLFFISNFKTKLLVSISSLFSLLISLLPTIIFDLRNNFLNLNGLFKFSQEKVDPDQNVLFTRLFLNILDTIKNLGSFIFFRNSNILIIITGLVLFAFFFYQQRKLTKTISKDFFFIIFWIILIPLIYVFYRHSIPEYYYVIQFPPLIYIISQLASQIKKIYLLIIPLCVYLISINLSYFYNHQGMTINNQLKINNYLNSISQEHGIKQVIYDMEIPFDTGLRFLTKDLIYAKEGKIVHLIYPYHASDFKTISYGDIALWIDPRTNPNLNYLTTQDFIISSPRNISVLKNFYQGTIYSTDYVFSIFTDDKIIGTLVIYLRQNEGEAWHQLKNQYQDLSLSHPNTQWLSASFNNQSSFIYNDNGHILLFVPYENNSNSISSIDSLNFIFTQ